MKPTRHTALLLVSCAAACSRQPEPAPTPGQSATVAIHDPERVADATTAAPDGLPTTLPAAMRGRYGMVPADCTTTRGDGKGLIAVSAEELRFYESVARLVSARVNGPQRVEGRFAYSGEGMAWQRQAKLELKDAGRTLVLEEFGPDAVPGPRVFLRCPA